MKVYFYGMPRSGSTKVRNILKFLVNENDLKNSHDFIDGNFDKVIINIRNIYDVGASHWRIYSGKYDKNGKLINKANYREVKGMIKTGQIKFKVFEEVMNKYKNNVFIIRYEDYFGKDDKLLKDICEYLEIEISKEKKEKILNFIDLKRCKEISNKIKNFNEFDENTHIHGNHIYTGKPNSWKEIVDKRFHDLYLKELKEINNKMGYND